MPQPEIPQTPTWYTELGLGLVGVGVGVAVRREAGGADAGVLRGRRGVRRAAAVGEKAGCCTGGAEAGARACAGWLAQAAACVRGRLQARLLLRTWACKLGGLREVASTAR